MVAGIIDHEAGTRDVTRARRPAQGDADHLRARRSSRRSRWAACRRSSASSPRKRSTTRSASPSVWSALFTLVAILGNALMFAIGFAVALKPFLGRRGRDAEATRMKARSLLWLGPVVLARAGLLAALLSPSDASAASRSPMAGAVAGEPLEIDISLIPSIGLPLLAVARHRGARLSRSIGRSSDVRQRDRGARLRAIGWGPDRGFDQVSSRHRARRAAITGADPERADGNLHDGDLRRHRAALLVPLVWSARLPALPDLPALALLRMGVIAIAVIGLGAVLYRRRPADGDRLARHPGLRGGADLPAVRRARSRLHPVHGRDAFGRDPRAGHDAPEARQSDHRPTREKLVDVTVARLCAASG